MTATYHLGLLLMRLGFSGLMLTHGIPKFIQLINGNFDFGDPIGIGPTASLILAVVGEFVCPILVILGIKTRISAIPIIITMIIAAFVVHAADPLGRKELALLYLIGFLVIALMGGGRFALSRNT
ncbi:DoxX family protein [Luteirhabdus pelagi]|uniref:DoxX family protein n=1 Tax=Luteirhabdus pelagi TaxID=2792783 RepID=UPI00193ACA31|nr:DoxX family protein [Luteirhabdus pelagi]